MTVVITQPGLLPWIGTFEKLRLATKWIHLDHVSFQKAGFLHRLAVRHPRGTRHWLTIPIGPQRFGLELCRVQMPRDTSWREKNLEAFTSYYKGAPFTGIACDLLQRVYDLPCDTVADLAIQAFEITADLLGLSLPEVFRSVRLGVNTRKSQMVADLVERVGGSSYLFGPGANELGGHYLDLDVLRQRRISLSVMQYEDCQYPQIGAGFTPRLSVLDALACVGVEGTHALLCSGSNQL
jgi:hypothetical protein